MRKGSKREIDSNLLAFRRAYKHSNGVGFLIPKRFRAALGIEAGRALRIELRPREGSIVITVAE